MKIVLHPPEGEEIRECVICKIPYLYGTLKLENCLWCEIHKEGKYT